MRGVFSLPPQYVDRGASRCCSQTSGSYSACSPFGAVAGRNHTDTCAGCIVSLTTPTRSLLRASRSVSLRSLAEKASRVFLACTSSCRSAYL
jgi:hypothetical protein